MKKIAIIQARMSSSRLPDKMMADLNGRPVIAWVVKAANAICGIDEVVVATSDDKSDDAIEKWCKNNKTECYRGSLDDVLRRFANAAEKYDADIIMRITGDCPLLDPAICSQLLQLLLRTNSDYASNCTIATWPDGLDCEVFTKRALKIADKEANKTEYREHVTGFIHKNRHRFKVETMPCPLPCLQGERWTLDNPEDLEFLRQVTKNLPDGKISSYIDVLNILDANPSLRKINTDIKRNEGLEKTKNLEKKTPITNFNNSTEFLKEAEKYIPLGSQTFSKSRVQYPVGHAPLFITHGNGGHVCDIDGNEYIDLVCGLLPVVLGYNDADVNYAIRSQLNNGIIFSQSSDLEARLAKKICEIIPCAQMVRFGKNGTDATSAAIRLARAYTGRDNVMVCGYHGWQDWYIGSTVRNKGVPADVSKLTHKVPYNDLEYIEKKLKEAPDSFAALIMEPMNVEEPKDGYFDDLKALLHKYGALLIFDETITGFRYSLGGAQELFGVKPDLATFGKAMGNGMPISAVVGRKDVMMEMENVFFSGTFGGETLSIVAALAVIEKMQTEPVLQKIWQMGRYLKENVSSLIVKHDLEKVVLLKGKDPWVVVSFIAYEDVTAEAIKTMWQKEMIANGVLTIGSHNICYGHSQADMDKVVAAYDNALSKIAESLKGGNFKQDIGCAVLEPVFKVR